MTKLQGETPAIRYSIDLRSIVQVWLPRLSCAVVGIVFLVAGWGKLNAPDATEKVLSFVGVSPPPLTQTVTAVLPGIEIALGVILLLGWSSRILLGCSMALLLGFTGFLTFLAVARYNGSCGCVGPIIDRWTPGGPVGGIVRNFVLLALLAWPAALAFRGRGSSHSHSRLGSRVWAARSVGLIMAILVPLWCHAQEPGPRQPAPQQPAPQDIRRPQFIGPWSPSYESQLRSIFVHRLVTEIAEWFEMTPDQTFVLHSMRDDHQDKFDAFVAEVAPIWQPLEDAILEHPLSTPARHQASVEWEIGAAEIADRQEALDMEFLPVIQSVLDQRQVERWDAFRLWLTRQRWSGRWGMYLEQPVDLIALLGQIDRRFPAELETVPEEIVLDYALRLDKAILEIATFNIKWSRHRMRNEMNRLQTDGERTWLGAWRNPTKAERTRRKRLSTRRNLRDVNHRYAGIFRSTLPEAKATAWRRLYRESVLRRVDFDSSLSQETNDLIIESIRMTPRIGRFVADIRDTIAELEESQYAAIETLIIQHEYALDAAFKRVVAAHDEFSDSSFRGVTLAERTALELKYRESVESYAGRERTTIQAILTLLTPDQKAIINQVTRDWVESHYPSGTGIIGTRRDERD